MIRKEMLSNQALSAHALFFDDVHRNLIFARDKENRPAGRYAKFLKGATYTKMAMSHFPFMHRTPNQSR